MITQEVFEAIANFCIEKTGADTVLILAHEGDSETFFGRTHGKIEDIAGLVYGFITQERGLIEAIEKRQGLGPWPEAIEKLAEEIIEKIGDDSP